MAHGPILVIELAQPAPEGNPILTPKDSWLLTAMSTYDDYVIFGFGVPDFQKDQTFSRIFEDIKPKADGSFSLELGVTLPDLLPNLDGKWDYSINVTTDDGIQRILCVSNRMLQVTAVQAGRQHHVILPSHGLSQLNTLPTVTVPDSASIKYLRTTVTMRFTISGVDAEAALEAGIETCMQEFTSALNRFLAAHQLTTEQIYSQFSTRYERNSFSFFYVMMEGTEDKLIRHGRLSTHTGRVGLTPPNCKEKDAVHFREYASGVRPLDAIRVMMQSAHSSFESGTLEVALLQMVIAAEMATSQLVKDGFIAAGVSNTKWNDSKKEIKYSDMLNLHLYTVTPTGLKPDSQLLGQVNRARGLRNELMHEGRFTSGRAEIDALLKATESYLSYLERVKEQLMPVNP